MYYKPKDEKYSKRAKITDEQIFEDFSKILLKYASQKEATSSERACDSLSEIELCHYTYNFKISYELLCPKGVYSIFRY